jgi:hypothetical protein
MSVLLRETLYVLLMLEALNGQNAVFERYGPKFLGWLRGYEYFAKAPPCFIVHTLPALLFLYSA